MNDTPVQIDACASDTSRFGDAAGTAAAHLDSIAESLRSASAQGSTRLQLEHAVNVAAKALQAVQYDLTDAEQGLMDLANTLTEAANEQ